MLFSHWNLPWRYPHETQRKCIKITHFQYTKKIRQPFICIIFLQLRLQIQWDKSLLKTEYKTICDRFLEAEIIRKQFIYVLSNFLFKSLVKCLFCKICFADILNPKYRAGNVLYSKQTYVYPFPEDTGPIKFRLSRDLFAGLKMGYFWPLI